MIDRDDLSDLHSAAVTVQEALAVLVERLEVMLPEPEPEAVPDAERFMDEPDARRERFIRGNKTQITLTISPALLDRVDEVVRRKEISRAALLTLWIGDGLAKEAA